ncbi:YgfZ/GcvT domain-containing protein [Aestuariibius sp. 2305UL40-4]|uniref:CAF17-like 4Fe-4S cluster assembly/insertion protein YgfZ n=1 Tax=Aestuariibius violaceus TaxID=3234132 RepID=UPI00345E4928
MTVLKVSGSEARKFLQDLVTNDLGGTSDGLVYAALLTPQGKYIADFLIFERDGALFVDVADSHTAALAQRLSMYKLRADVTIEEAGLAVTRGRGAPPEGAFADPRHPALGWRGYDGQPGEDVDWDAIRVAHVIPEAGLELTPDSYILEAGFERLNGVDFKKGCFVGQEIVARMKHKTALRKGLVKVAVEGAAEPGTPIVMADGREAGTLHTRAGDEAIAFLRFDRAKAELTAGEARVVPLMETAG